MKRMPRKDIGGWGRKRLVGTVPRYFFDFHDTGKTLSDEEGLELADLATAKHEAVRALAEITRDVLPDGPHKEIAMAVRDEQGHHLARAIIRFDLLAE
jgi:hypothetical protein